MNKEVLFATTNPHKKLRFQNYYEPLGLTVVSFSDVLGNIDVVEDGKTPEENALKKATAGFLATRMPSFAVDYWLRIEGLHEDEQPGPYVRRIFTGDGGQREAASDDEMLDYYVAKIKKLGGEAKGIWTSAIALVISEEKQFVESFSRETLMTSERSPSRTNGEPLNSIQIDPKSGKYFTDLTISEWLKLQSEKEGRYINFMRKHLQEI
jgi:XTP/dITP diphosphohydrolase